MSDLITVPTFTFYQGDIWEQEEKAERPINVDYYDNGELIILRQEDASGQKDEVLIRSEYLPALFKEIKKHMPEVVRYYKKLE